MYFQKQQVIFGIRIESDTIIAWLWLPENLDLYNSYSVWCSVDWIHMQSQGIIFLCLVC